MARVYERPRYVNQARNRLLSLAAATHDLSLKLSVARALKVSPSVKEAMYPDYELLAENAYDEDIDTFDEVDLDLNVAEFLLDAEIGRSVSGASLTAEEPAFKIVSDFLAVQRVHKPSVVYSDEAAVYYLLKLAMDDTTFRAEDDAQKFARSAATNLLKYQLPSQKVSPKQFNDAYRVTPLFRQHSSKTVNDDLWLQAAENLQYRAQPMWVKYCRLWAAPPRRLRSQVIDMVEKVEASKPSDRHRFFPLDRVCETYAAYNYLGTIVIYYGRHMLIIDNSAADYLRTAMTALRNGRIAFSCLRVAGDVGKSDYSQEFTRCVSWMSKQLGNPTMARHVARHMHLAYTMWQNEAGEADAEIGCAWEERVKPLRDDMLSYYPYDSTWWDLVKSIRCPERLKAEFLKLYHLLPPPDIDPILLHDTMEERTSSANHCDQSKTNEFLLFCMAYDFCRFMSKNHKVPSHKALEGYSFEESKWAKSCLRGVLMMPPKDEWGKVKLHKEFAYPHSGDFHVLDAKDSTRIVADLSMYMDRSKSRSLERKDQNELLSALFNGGELSNGMSMSDWRQHVMGGGKVLQGQCIAAEAGKAENTKPGKKVRETLSASDVVREYLTEVDHSLRPLAEMTPGVSIRVNMVKHKKKFQTMARALSKRATGYAFGTSTDITGWSPMMDRSFFHQWQEYALSTTECENPKAQVQLWDKLQVFCDRRGVKRVFDCNKGNIQGWPATSDTTMHAHILIYWAYELRARGILSRREAAYTLCLIDDAATVVALEGSPEECKAKALAAKDLLVELYLSYGFLMDTVKSFFSSIKFTYLNELYIDGTQVGHGTKTLMRIDKDHSRRFASLTDNIATAFGTAASAASQGSDPFVAYWIAALLSFRWLYRVDPRVADIDPVGLAVYALAPTGLNGLGIRPVTSVFASGENDHLTWFIEVAGSMVQIIGADVNRHSFNAFLNQEMKVPTAMSTFKTPFSLSAASHSTASAIVSRRFREAARSNGLAEPFASLDKVEDDQEFEESLDKVLQSGTYEAALLEEVSANMPMSLVDQILSRIDKTEIIAYMLGGRGVGDLRRRAQNADKFNVHTGMSTARTFKQTGMDWLSLAESSGSFACAYELRERLYSSTEYSVVNHTYPCPFSLWAFNGDIDLNTEQARRMTTVSFNVSRLFLTAGSESRNMYDSATDTIGYRGYMTARSDAGREARVALTDPVRRMVASGLAAFRWAHNNGAHYMNLYKLYLSAWCGIVDERLMELPGRTLSGSAKRLSLRHSKASHLVYPFQNVQSALRVDARAITVANSSVSHMYDIMGAITTLRIAGLLEMSLLMRNGKSGFAYGFTYHEKSAAVIKVPNIAEAPLPDATWSKMTPFTMIESPMRKSSLVVTSYDSMSAVLITYVNAGEKAARSLFDSMMANQELSTDIVTNHTQQVLELDTSNVYANPLQKPWTLKPHDTKSKASGAVTEPGSRRTSSVSTDVPRGTLADQLSHVASAWADTMLVDLVIKDAVFATQLMWNANKRSPSDCLNIPGWEDKFSYLVPHDRAIRGIISEVESLVPNRDAGPHLAQVFAKFGATGFRLRELDSRDDLMHASKSFFATTASLIGIASRVGAGMNRLRHKDAADYSRIIATAGAASSRSISRVIRAQWLSAAARRQIRADERASRGLIGNGTTSDNYQAVFLRLAAGKLRTSGYMDLSSFCSEAITRVIQSITNHLGEGNKSEAFEEALESSGADFEEMAIDVSTAEMAIMAVCNMAMPLDNTVDPGSITQAFRQVYTWVDADLSGAHGSSPVAQRRTSMFLSSLARQSPGLSKPVTTADTSRKLDFEKIVVGEEMDQEVDIEEIQPSLVANWLMTIPGGKAAVEAEFGPGTLNHWYRQMTVSKEVYRLSRDSIILRLGMPQYTDQEYSPFEEPEWADDDAAFVVD